MSSEQVQVEARTLSGMHIGQRVSAGGVGGRVLVSVGHAEDNVSLFFRGKDGVVSLAPTDLVTLTGGGADV